MTADLFGAVAGHQADDEAANDGNEYHPDGARRLRHRHGGDAETVEPDEVRHQRDEADQNPGGKGAARADDQGHADQGQNALVGGEIPGLAPGEATHEIMGAMSIFLGRHCWSC